MIGLIVMFLHHIALNLNAAAIPVAAGIIIKKISIFPSSFSFFTQRRPVRKTMYYLHNFSNRAGLVAVYMTVC